MNGYFAERLPGSVKFSNFDVALLLCVVGICFNVVSIQAPRSLSLECLTLRYCVAAASSLPSVISKETFDITMICAVSRNALCYGRIVDVVEKFVLFFFGVCGREK